MPRRRMTVSTKNQYYLPKFRSEEIRYFCLQYPEWKKQYNEMNLQTRAVEYRKDKSKVTNAYNKTEETAMTLFNLSNKIKMVEDSVHIADCSIDKWLLLGITEDKTYEELFTVYNIPCSRQYYYKQRRKVLWLVSKERN